MIHDHDNPDLPFASELILEKKLLIPVFLLRMFEY